MPATIRTSTGCRQIVVMGVAGSGKTAVGERLAARFGLAFIEGDRLHPPANIARMAAGTPLTDADRAPWLAAIAALLARAHADGVSTIVTCSALRRTYRDTLRGALPEQCVCFLHLHADFAVLHERMQRRTGHFMPATLLRSQFDTLEPLEPDECGTLLDVRPALETLTDEAAAAILSLPGPPLCPGEHAERPAHD